MNITTSLHNAEDSCTFLRSILDNLPESPLSQHQSVVQVGSLTVETGVIAPLPALHRDDDPVSLSLQIFIIVSGPCNIFPFIGFSTDKWHHGYIFTCIDIHQKH